jgi:hypothetical protein
VKKAVAAAVLAVSSVAVGSAAHAASGNYTCTGGAIPSGSYNSITVTGQCTVAPNAVIRVGGNVNVAPGALLDGQESPAIINVGGNITVGAGAYMALGCQPANTIGTQAGEPCATDPAGHTTIRVGGSVRATNAADVTLRGLRVGGSVTAIGGGDGQSPWAWKGLTVGGNVTADNITPEFFVVEFNRIGGTVNLHSIHETDTDPAPFVGVIKNVIGGSLHCTDLTPRATVGFNPANVNVVGGEATGQCAALV